MHDEMIEACILEGPANEEPRVLRRQFSTYPADLIAFAEWLNEHECFHVAMESTGVYWKPIYEAIKKHCIRSESLIVANAQHMRTLPGRKNDPEDAKWIARLLRHGLLDPSFIPNHDITTLREVSRLYRNCVSEKSRFINRIHKFLSAHGFKLSSVLSDITCVSGLNILDKLALKGSLSVNDVDRCLRGHTKHSASEIQYAMSGSLIPMERQLLSLLLKNYRAACTKTDEAVALMKEIASPYKRQLDLLDSIPGIDVVSSLLILAEIGEAPFKSFETSSRFCKWAGVSPRNDGSAGKIKSRKILPGNPYLKPILCQVAWVAVKSRNNRFRDWFWSRKGRLGEKTAIIAVARKILSVIYALLRDDTPFVY